MEPTQKQPINKALTFLHERARVELFEPFLLECHRVGLPVMVLETWRHYLRQQFNYEQGREFVDGRWVITEASAVVTHAPPGFSPHEAVMATPDGVAVSTILGFKVIPASLALDAIPLGDNGVYDAGDWKNISAFVKMGEIGEKVGLVSGGKWKMRDFPHLEVPGIGRPGSPELLSTLKRWSVTFKQSPT